MLLHAYYIFCRVLEKNNPLTLRTNQRIGEIKTELLNKGGDEDVISKLEEYAKLTWG
jgi:hypothetical protein